MGRRIVFCFERKQKIMKILVTGHKGFIGSHMAQYLVHKGHEVEGFDYVENVVPAVDQYDWVIHLGAISDTTERDVNKVWKHNYEFTLRLLQVCDHYSTNIQLASTAAVYGPNTAFNEQDPVYPQTPYAWSKYLIDKFLNDNGIDQFNMLVQSFRYFNVYGPGEGHKGDQMSMVSKFQRQASENGVIKLFKNSELKVEKLNHSMNIILNREHLLLNMCQILPKSSFLSN